MTRFLKQKKRENLKFAFNSITAKERLPVFHSRFGRQWKKQQISDSSSHEKTEMSIPNLKIPQILQVFEILEQLLMFRSYIFVWFLFICSFVCFLLLLGSFGSVFCFVWVFFLILLQNPKVCHTAWWFWEAELVSGTVLQALCAG